MLRLIFVYLVVMLGKVLEIRYKNALLLPRGERDGECCCRGVVMNGTVQVSATLVNSRAVKRIALN